MSSDAAVGQVVDALEHLQIPYMIVGAYSSNSYGIPRSTKDADFVVALQSGDLQRLMEALGAEFRLNRQIQLETITSTVRNVIVHRPTRFDIELFRVSKDPHDEERFRRRCRRLLGNHQREVWMPTAEDVVIQKLRWNRRKDLEDARNILAVRFDDLDWSYLEQWTKAHQTHDVLHALRTEVSDLNS